MMSESDSIREREIRGLDLSVISPKENRSDPSCFDKKLLSLRVLKSGASVGFAGEGEGLEELVDLIWNTFEDVQS